MKNPVDLFDVSCAENNVTRYWPIAPEHASQFESQRKEAETVIESIRATDWIKGLPPIHFDFIDRGTLDAVADLQDNGQMGIVGFYRGAVLIPPDTFDRMLSHPKILPQIGDVSRESLEEHHGLSFSIDYDVLIASRTEAGISRIPKTPVDPTRDRFSKLCSIVVADFLLNHEISHVAQGHLGYLYANRHLAHDPITRQTLEMNADAWATSSSFINFIRRLAYQPASPGEQGYIPAEDAIFIWCFAIACLFCMWDLKFKTNDLVKDLHMPPGMRMIASGSSCQEFLSKRMPYARDSFDFVRYRIMREVFPAALTIGLLNHESGFAFAESAVDPMGRQHLGKLLQRWKEIRPEIKKHSFSMRISE